MKKIFTCLLSLAFCVSLGAEEFKTLSFGQGIPGMDEPEMSGFGISPNGRYVCGMVDFGEGVFVMDLETGVYNFEYVSDSELHNINNDGIGIGYLGDLGVTYSWNGEIVEQKTAGENCKYILAEDLTNDGSVKVGTFVTSGFETFGAYSVNDGDWTRLPALPSDTPEENDQESMATGVSGDGKYIIGYVDNFGPIIVWTRNEDGSYEPEALYKRYCAPNKSELDKKPLVNLTAQAISNNGLYILCAASKVVVDEDGEETQLNFPAVFNTATQELKLYDEPQNIDTENKGLTGSAIADDGTFVGIIGYMMSSSDYGCFIMKAGETQAQLFLDVFPKYKEKFEISDIVGNSIPTDISADGRYILGYAYYSDDTYGGPAYSVTYIIDRGEIENAVCAIESQPVSEEIYSLDGVRLSELKKGVNIIRLSAGSVRKVIR
ncbi:MAG: hypothetical protein K2K32_09570 [Muribaculaceae bacterium]|nr:hypothetical protein [Muribaculaceae bacterium]